MTKKLAKVNKKAEIANQAFWDEIASVHYKSYDIEKLKQGKSLIDEIQKKEMGDVKDKSLLHLQCHIGTDSLSWVIEGAQVTGVDFSSESIKIANELKRRLGLKVRFIESNIYDLPDTLKEKFDIVYTSQGVLTWLKDIKEWGKIISHYLKPGGIFYIMEIHPLFYIFDDDKQGELKIKESYFPGKKPTLWDDDTPDYSDGEYIPKNPTYDWTWPLGEIVASLIEAGLKIEFLHEYDKLFYKGFPDMIQDEKGWWYLPKYKGMLPLTFTLRANKNLPEDRPLVGFERSDNLMKANPIVWWELASHDAEKTADFLKKVFGWEIEYDETIKSFDFPIPKDSRNLSGGGVFTLRKAKLPFLTFYIQVEDIDKKAKLIEQLGGYILEAPFEIPGGSRICLFNEPSGVTLAMLEKKK